MAARLRVHPPGPYPPHGVEAEGEVDLGIRVRDLLFTKQAVTGWGRKALSDRLAMLVRDPSRMFMASAWLDDFPMTWPLGAMIDDARERWIAGPDESALACMLKASHLLAPVLGWPTTIDRRWPMPDPDWVKKQVGDAQCLLQPRARGDGTTGISIVLEAEVAPASLCEERVLELGLDEIVAAPERILEALAGSAEAVMLTSPGPSTEADREVWRAVRDAGRRQRAYERGGLAGLSFEHVPHFDDLLTDAPPGVMGERLSMNCDALLLPRIDEKGELGLVGVLVWDAPYRPVRVVPTAVEVLRHLDGTTTAREIAQSLEASEESLLDVLEQLVGLGAATVSRPE